ncbi:MAG: hypothetical protein K9K76_00345 [Halanaerobiales bacterium]|nr:hypothetical protein [Halanaerobiales bacterium]
MKISNKKLQIITFSLLFVFTIVLFSIPSNAAYVSNSLTSRYVYDIENGKEHKISFIYDVNYEKKFNKNDIYGEININPIFEYNLETESENFKFKEAYIDFYFPRFDLRAGKQKLTWGKSDGIVITNIVNPRDYTVHPVVEYSDQFKGVNALKLNLYPKNNNLEVVLVPEFKSATMNKNILLNKIPNNFKKDDSEKEIESNFENSELFIRYSSIGQKFDYELMAAYSWDDEPTLHKNLQEMTIVPQHHRLTTVGGSVSTMKGPYVFRGEGAYISGNYFNLETPKVHLNDYPEGVIEKNVTKWLVGIDYNYNGYLLSAQFMQEAILDYREKIAQDEFSNQMTFLIQKDFMRSKLNTEINFHYNLNDEVLMFKPTINYDYSDVINLKAGANINLEGEIFKEDVVYFQTEYLF